MITLPPTIRVRLTDGTVRTLPLEEYLRAVVPQEMPPDWPQEALRAQAVAARTFAARAVLYPRHADKGADVCTEEHCQAYRPAQIDARSDAAIQATVGVALSHDGRLIDALFSAACGGRTLSSEERKGWNAIPYLRSRACPCQRTKYGHGVGMCQWGARRMAEAGKGYKAILLHYYTGVILEEPAPAAAPVWPEVDAPLLHRDAFDELTSARWHAEEAVRKIEAKRYDEARAHLLTHVIDPLTKLEKMEAPK